MDSDLVICPAGGFVDAAAEIRERHFEAAPNGVGASRPPRVIASAAKQSILLCRTMDYFAALAMTQSISVASRRGSESVACLSAAACGSWRTMTNREAPDIAPLIWATGFE